MTFLAVLERLQEIAVALQNAPRAQAFGDDVASGPGGWPGPPPPEAVAFLAFCDTLPEEQVRMAAAVMYLGRGDFGAARDVRKACRQLSATLSSKDRVARQMLEKPQLTAYLADGLAHLRRNGVSPDALCRPRAEPHAGE